MSESLPSASLDGVDPALVPVRRLNTGAAIPARGLGTFGSDKYTGEQVAQAVADAAAVGYRHFDCRFTLDQAAQAYEVADRGQSGKVVVTFE